MLPHRRARPSGPPGVSAWVSLWLPRTGIALVVIGYLVAASRYPGGSRLEPRHAGYDHLANFWCDLLDVTAYDGRPNGGRAVALGATLLLPLTLLPLWLGLGRLWPATARRRWVVPGFGALAMVAMTFVSTRAHDAAITVGALSAGIALTVLLRRLHASQIRALLLSGLLATTAGACHYAAYVGGAPVEFLPGLQKLAGAALLAWLWQLAPLAAAPRHPPAPQGSRAR